LVKKFPNFLKRAATFVTLTINGNLRGCIGSLVAHQALLDDILTNAQKAALVIQDFRHLQKMNLRKLK